MQCAAVVAPPRVAEDEDADEKAAHRHQAFDPRQLPRRARRELLPCLRRVPRRSNNLIHGWTTKDQASQKYGSEIELERDRRKHASSAAVLNKSGDQHMT